MKKTGKKNPWAQVGRYSQLAFVMPGCVAAGYAIGYYLDRYFETSFLYLVFLVFGIVAGFIEMIREIQKDQVD